VRYDIGDLAVLPEAAAESEDARERISLGVSTFNGIEGRRSDCLKLADGSRVFGLDRVPSGVDGAASVQIVQVAPAAVLMVVVPNAQYTEETLAILTASSTSRCRTMWICGSTSANPLSSRQREGTGFISQVQETAC
jgi:phosphoribosyl-AMP cyclohydrolase